MSNKIAPYKDSKVIKMVKAFNDEYRVKVNNTDGTWSEELSWPMYRHYLKWMVSKDDLNLLAMTLNKPQFDKVFQVVAAAFATGK
jgi:hypothetical protein